MMIDLFTCYLNLKYNRKKSGASGFPVVTLFLYVILALRVPNITIMERIIGSVVAIVLHSFIVFLIPAIDAYFLEKR